MRIFHVAEGGLDMRLATIAPHDLLIAPVAAIREEDRLAEQRALEIFPGLRFEAPTQNQPLTFSALDRSTEQLFHMPTAQDGIDALLRSGKRRFFTRRA